MRRGIWLIDASLAFILILVTMQLCLLWMSGVVDATVSFHGTAQRQAELLAASDKLINDRNCLAAVDQKGKRALPQTINSSRIDAVCNGHIGCWNATANISCGATTSPQGHGGLVVRRLVFMDVEGGEPHLLEVW